MSLRCAKCNYFTALLQEEDSLLLQRALDMMVSDLKIDRNTTNEKLFDEKTMSLDVISALIGHVGNPNTRIAGNAAYILGMIAETLVGLNHVMLIISGSRPEPRLLLRNLTNLFACSDKETIMNSAGTISTLADNHEGRRWMLADPCVREMISCLSDLLENPCRLTASNAALVLARLSVTDEGCAVIMSHRQVDVLLTRLVEALGDDVEGLGRNAAFAVGRICDKDVGRKRLLQLSTKDRMVSALVGMLQSGDSSSCKSACFALCCIASSLDGHACLLRDDCCRDMIATLVHLLDTSDHENRWFAAMTLRKLVQIIGGRTKLLEHEGAYQALTEAMKTADMGEELREELTATLKYLVPLTKPLPPCVQSVSENEINVKWNRQILPFEPVTYKLFEGSLCVYDGSATGYSLCDLTPSTEYSLRIQAVMGGEESPLSECTLTVTAPTAIEEAVVGPPEELTLITRHATQLKIGWQAPAPLEPPAVVRYYSVYVGAELREKTAEHQAILSGLLPSTVYEVSVRTVSSIGRSPKATLTCTTADIGDHAPSKPEVIVRGRCELCVAWRPPLVPLARITRYDLSVDGCVVYSGTDLRYNISRLKPGTEYTISVCVITSEGRCESKPTKKKKVPTATLR